MNKDDVKDIPPSEVPKTITKQDESESMEGGKRSAWMVHVKKTMRANPSKKLTEVLKMAAKTYKKSGKKTARKSRKGKKFLGMFGGAAAAAETATPVVTGEASPMAGGRRRRGRGSRKTKGSRKH
jgi:hypothetical protein